MIISKHLQLGSPLKISNWRKAALGLWRSPTDPSVYGIIEMDMKAALDYIDKLKEKYNQKITISHFICRAMAIVLEKHPSINCVHRWGKLYPRKTIDIFFQVANDSGGKDLSGITINNAEKKSILEISQNMENEVKSVREKNDPRFNKMKFILGILPSFMVTGVIKFISFVLYTLNCWSPLFKIPKNPYGSIMITNIGSLGLDLALVPLIPCSKIPLLIAIGSIKDRAVVKNGKIEIVPTCKMGVTFDHRIMDGVMASLMLKTVNEIFSHPEKELGLIN